MHRGQANSNSPDRDHDLIGVLIDGADARLKGSASERQPWGIEVARAGELSNEHRYGHPFDDRTELETNRPND